MMKMKTDPLLFFFSTQRKEGGGGVLLLAGRNKNHQTFFAIVCSSAGRTAVGSAPLHATFASIKTKRGLCCHSLLLKKRSGRIFQNNTRRAPLPPLSLPRLPTPGHSRENWFSRQRKKNALRIPRNTLEQYYFDVFYIFYCSTVGISVKSAVRQRSREFWFEISLIERVGPPQSFLN
ncbi:hypothetical protein CEXT_571761 [Caerostris extrusa]|uniref:Uncharacterized protein n=1 Tax=Caerostris extrusa TaxID=172846 RepID=A0AAV4PLN4_CAEEX|nr:hypothetical protein CEXT_571761 [Caerostris extrusa]